MIANAEAEVDLTPRRGLGTPAGSPVALLYESDRTVSAKVSNIVRKPGVSSLVDAAAAAQRSDVT